MKLSVLIITYNHEKFIAQALDSVLMQETNFAYEIVVGEDCSSDQTRSILLAYQQKHPGKIRLLLPEKNLGMLHNFVNTLRACTGQYIALLEGDDYWTSPHKLQRQVEFLDAHLDYAACFHNVMVAYDVHPPNNHPFHRRNLKARFTLKDVASKPFIPTCSTVFRNRLLKDFPEWYYTLSMGDWPLHVLNAEQGDFGYRNELLATYRVHEGGLWSSAKRTTILKNTITAAHVIDHHLNHRFCKNSSTLIAGCNNEIAKIHLSEKNYDGASYHAEQTLKFAQPYNIVLIGSAMTILLKTAMRSLAFFKTDN